MQLSTGGILCFQVHSLERCVCTRVCAGKDPKLPGALLEEGCVHSPNQVES